MLDAMIPTPIAASKEYRDSYVASHVKRWVARQIRVLREQPERAWNQGELAKRLGKPQSVVSRLEDPKYGNMTLNTMLELASVFDVALVVKFVSLSRFKDEFENLETDALKVECFLQGYAQPHEVGIPAKIGA